MTRMTEAAGELLQQVQAQQHGGNVLRVEAGPDGLIIGASAPGQHDEVLFHRGEPVLRLSPDAASLLAGCTIATEDSADGPQLTILAPAEDEPAR